MILKGLACLGLLFLAACGTGIPVEQTPASSQEALTATPSTPPPIETTSGEQGGLSGVVFSASDVSGQPDQPLPGQLVLAAARQEFARLAGLSEEDMQPERLRFARARLEKPDPAIVTTLSGADGRYALEAPPGEIVLCLAQAETDFPLVTRGCGLVMLAPGEQKVVDISSGFGEILLEEHAP